MRKLLLPISLLYSLVLKLRHWCYDSGILKSYHFPLPVICIGNLSLGGTGKTPHTEYLIKLLKEEYQVTVLSRGYGRKTKGFVMGNSQCDSRQLGDEPMQYLRKFSDILVAVDEDRVEGINKLSVIPSSTPQERKNLRNQVILLDDAFQHRKIQAGLNILLTEYDNLYCDDYLIPAGNLRDIRSAAHRADIIIVSKSPASLSNEEKDAIVNKLKIKDKQRVYFSRIEYESLLRFTGTTAANGFEAADSVLLFSGIAHPNHLVNHLHSIYKDVETLSFSDHHSYSEADIRRIISTYEKMDGSNKIIVTTEKDAARLANSVYLCLFESVPIYVAPIHVSIIEKEKFNKDILDYVRENTRNCGVSTQGH